MNVRERLDAIGQEHLGVALDRLPPDARGRLEADLAALDLDLVARLVTELTTGATDPLAGAEILPAEIVGLPADELGRAREREATEAGEELLRSGAVAAVLLAGGQGTRLGFEGPKGMFPFAPVTGRTLFWHHAAKVAAVRARYGCPLPWYILTSPQNDAATRGFFAEHDHFGLDPATVRFVVQGTLPAVDRDTGRLLLEAPDRLARSPDGHGGLLSALRRSGALAEMRAAGVRTLFTFQVDNPLVRLARPAFLGYHVLAGAEMANVVVQKNGPKERMGVVATLGGRPAVVEYSDLPDELAEARAPDGSLLLGGGSIAVHCLQLDFVERLTESGLALPYHRAVKKVPHVDAEGRPLRPDEPNAVKFETFLFDALTSAARTVNVEAAREDEFSPIKNAEGDDSPATARRDLNRLGARWLEAAGVAVPRDAAGEPPDIEIDPRLALDPDELARRLPPSTRVDGPTLLEPPAA